VLATAGGLIRKKTPRSLTLREVQLLNHFMTLAVEYERAMRDAEIARVRRVLALRAMLAQGSRSG